MPTSPIQRVAEDLRVAIYRSKTSQEVVAERSGISRSAVSRRLTGEVEMTLSELGAIAGAVDLDVSVEFTPALAESHTSSDPSPRGLDETIGDEPVGNAPEGDRIARPSGAIDIMGGAA
jgi:transcriptional regulator with XRE-family HTH domain